MLFLMNNDVNNSGGVRSMALTLSLLDENSVIGWRVVEALLAPRILSIALNQGARKASTSCHPSNIVILKFKVSAIRSTMQHMNDEQFDEQPFFSRR
jgi:hypothetical protein